MTRRRTIHLLALCIALLTVASSSPLAATEDANSQLKLLRELHRRSQPDSVRALADQLSHELPFDVPGIARRDLLSVWGQSEASFGRGRFAEPLLREALDLSRSASDDTTSAALLRWVGVSVGLQGRVDEADSIYAELLLAANDLGDKELSGWAHVGQGWCALQRGELQRSVDENRMARQLHRQAGSAVGYAWAMNTEAIALRRQGDFVQARSLYVETVKNSQAMSGATMLHAMALANLGNLEMILGDPERALESFHRAEAIHLAFRHEREAAVATLDRCVALLALSRKSEAIAALDSLQRHSREHGWKDLEAKAANERASAQWSVGQTEVALQAYSQTRRRQDLPFRARADAASGERMLLLELGRPEEVLDLLSVSGPTEEPEVRAQRACSKSRALRETGQPDRARRAILPYATADSLAQLATANQLDVLIEAARSCSQAGDTTAGHGLLLEAASRWEGYRASASETRWREQRAAWASQIFPALAVSELGTEPDSTSLMRLFLRMQAAKARTLMERVRGPVAPPKKSGAVRSPSKVLTKNEVFLDLHLDRGEGVLFVVRTNGVQARVVPGAANWRGRLRRLATLHDQPEVLNLARRALQQRLLGPLSSILTDSTQVFWCADGPFLASAGDIAPEWTLIPSWSLLSEIRTHEEPARGGIIAHVVGAPSEPPLPSAVREIRWLRDRYDATTPSTDELWAGTDTSVLHFAGHVAARLDVPWSTSLRILDERTASTESRSWPAWRIASGRGAPSLVVLSGCSTVSGRELPGEGLSGLASAFLSAGTRSIVATRWPVEDHFAERFTHTLYQELDRGLTVGEAVVIARQQHQSAADQPEAFVVVGDPSLRVQIAR